MGLDEFERMKVIGKGSYGEVWLSKHRKDRKQYVLKKMNLQKASKRERKSAEQEAKLLSRLKHPNIVSYKDSFEAEDGFLYIAMQYCEGGDLYTRLKEQRGSSLEERQVVEWFVQIAMALQYMHERNILHRDLKTQNIFLTKSKIIKVGDLGIARVLDSSSDMATTLIGTPYYMSPELFSNKPYNHKSDVWALGCCVYEMATLKHAFNARDMNSLVYKILRGRMPSMPRQYSPELVTLIRSMLHQDPEKRPSVNRILRDPYIKKNIAIFLEDTKRNRRPSTASSSRPSSRPSSASERRAVAPSPGIPPQAPRPDVGKATPSPSPAGFEAGDPPRYSHARKPSDAKTPDLDPIHEKSEDFSVASSSAGTGGTGSTQDTVVPQTVREAKSPKREPHKKSRFLRNRARNGGDSGASGTDKSEDTGEAGSKSGSGSSDVRPSHRPLPVPKVEESAGLPQKREPLLDRAEKAEMKSSNSSSSKSSASSSKEDNVGLEDATPRHSLPNLSARARRREKNPTANSLEHPNSARIHLRKPVERHMSEKVTKSERREMIGLKKEESALKKEREAARGAVALKRGMRQPSLNDSTSSDDSVKTQEEPAVQKKRHFTYVLCKENSCPSLNLCKEDSRESKEMNNFISLLDTTLHMNKEDFKSDDEDDVVLGKPRKSNGMVETPPPPPPPEPERPLHKSASMPSTDTLANTSRLMDRIRLLQKDCIQGVGYDLMKKAYDILDHIEEDEVEPRLVALLGKEKFDEYAGKIWQLKFCEESLFMK